MPKPDEPEISTSIVRAIADTEISDAITELGDITIDLFLNDSFLRDLPVLGFLLKFIRSGRDIRDYFFTRKIFKFCQSTKLTEKERSKFSEKLAEDPRFARDTGEKLMIIIDQLDEIDKIPMLAKLFKAYIDDRIDRALFRRLASAIDKAFIDDLNSLLKLEDLYERPPFFKQLLLSGLTEMSDQLSVTNWEKQRARGRGLAPLRPSSVHPFQNSNDDYVNLRFEVSELGKLFIEIVKETEDNG
ncbi:hypothetical protein V0288_23775 [Pannus brasiliensis CCIBt3594]|uniref:Uncharacterized protein n=1 Tax=Pannus brasiliensis CCIBt3594 TaxID=1427578 RepID=A0AAW9QXG9_9CHRO